MDDAPPLLREPELRLAMELLFCAYRDFTSEPDAILARMGLGRAHHRVIYFVDRYPGIGVGELLGILRITKQSLARVLRDLIARGYLSIRPGAPDRRRRRLDLTPAGIALERQLSAPQRARIAASYEAAGAAAVEGFRQVMAGLVDEADRPGLTRCFAALTGGAGRP